MAEAKMSVALLARVSIRRSSHCRKRERQSDAANDPRGNQVGPSIVRIGWSGVQTGVERPEQHAGSRQTAHGPSRTPRLKGSRQLCGVDTNIDKNQRLASDRDQVAAIVCRSNKRCPQQEYREAN